MVSSARSSTNVRSFGQPRNRQREALQESSQGSFVDSEARKHGPTLLAKQPTLSAGVPTSTMPDRRSAGESASVVHEEGDKATGAVEVDSVGA